jgi:hypothetical protein
MKLPDERFVQIRDGTSCAVSSVLLSQENLVLAEKITHIVWSNQNEWDIDFFVNLLASN